MADGLSRRSLTATDLVEANVEEDINDFILAELNSLRVSPISLDEPTFIRANNYSDDSWKIATYLTTLRRPPEMNVKEFNAFKKKAMKFKVQNNYLFCRRCKNLQMRRVVDDPMEQQIILQPYTMRAVIKDEKPLINGLQTDIGEITYTKKLRRTYKRMRSASILTLLDL